MRYIPNEPIGIGAATQDVVAGASYIGAGARSADAAAGVPIAAMTPISRIRGKLKPVVAIETIDIADQDVLAATTAHRVIKRGDPVARAAGAVGIAAATPAGDGAEA